MFWSRTLAYIVWLAPFRNSQLWDFIKWIWLFLTLFFFASRNNGFGWPRGPEGTNRRTRWDQKPTGWLNFLVICFSIQLLRIIICYYGFAIYSVVVKHFRAPPSGSKLSRVPSLSLLVPNQSPLAPMVPELFLRGPLSGPPGTVLTEMGDRGPARGPAVPLAKKIEVSQWSWWSWEYCQKFHENIPSFSD